MTSTSEDDLIIQQADDIASQITKLLVEAFKSKEGRDPTPEEVEQLIEEVTVERIEELLSGNDSNHTENADGDENAEDQEESGDEAEDDAVDENHDENDNEAPVESSIPDSFANFMKKTETLAASKQQTSPSAVAEAVEEREVKRRRIDA